jgi:nucleotide-binding universal stress UspA family protein
MSNRPILIAYDGSDYAKAAIALAAEQLGSDRRAIAEEGAVLARQAGFDAEPAVERGDPVWQRIIETADERGAGIVVLGSHGRTGIPRVLIGSVAGAVASHSKRPVLIVNS